MTKLTSLVATLFLTLAAFVAQAAGDSKAADLLAQARAALGGDALAKVQALSCAGTVQRTAGDRQIGGELTLDLRWPDKMIRSDAVSPLGNGALVVVDQGINGDALLRGSHTENTAPGMVVRLPPAPAPGSDEEAQALKSARAELARLTLALLAAAPTSMPLEFAYGGEAEAPDGKADVVAVKGPNGFAAQFFLDKSTHRPLMLAYRGVSPQMRVQTVRGPAPETAAHGGRPEPDGHGTSPESPQLVDITMFFDDYKSVSGVMLPHHITRSVDGAPAEEWTFKTMVVNPPFKPDTFTVK